MADKRQKKYDDKKAAADRANAKEKAAQDKLRKAQESKHPPKMTREDRKRAKRMPGRPEDDYF